VLDAHSEMRSVEPAGSRQFDRVQKAASRFEF